MLLTPGACLPTASVRPLTMPALICSQHSTAECSASAASSKRCPAQSPGNQCQQTLTAPYLEQVITRHARFPRHARRHDDNVGALERLRQLIISGVALQTGAAGRQVPDGLMRSAAVQTQPAAQQSPL
jgi:hypothetical protein